ncbi:MAG: bifunctional phosphoribosylaminoimidazolecarboxamide formyltransferase/IMP cyclohydrolase [Natronomonas sp.]
MQLAGMASNRGRNLLHVADTAPGGATFSVIVTNHADVPIVDEANARDIPIEIVERTDGESREDHEQRILDRLDDYEVDMICLDGYMRILTETFLENTPRTLNVHPSLLPSFPGLDAHEQVLEAGVSITGCTVHVVDETVDGGPIVTQESVPVYEGDDPEDLKRRVLYEAEFAAYPRAIRWFAADAVTVDGSSVVIDADEGGTFPARLFSAEDRGTELRYGENPHQNAAVYEDLASSAPSVVAADQRNEGAKALSYNNYNDADAALNLVREFDEIAAAVIKHTNPAGCATADSLESAYERALSTDPMSAFGGIVALNRPCDAATAEAIADSFKEVVVAPGYTDDALDVLTQIADLRVLDVGDFDGPDESVVETDLVGGRLVQERDRQTIDPADLEVVTKRAPTDDQLETMCFAWQTIKHVKSNAIVFATGTETVGIGMGQVSRVDAVRLAAMKAEETAEGKHADGAVMASDAFFPFPDGIEVAAEAGIEAVVQPGGSVNDDEVIAAADEHDVAMAFTGQRAFLH